MKTTLTRIALLLLTIQGVVDAQTNSLAPISIRANEKQKILSEERLKLTAIKNINKEIALLKQQVAELQEIKAELYNNIDSLVLLEDEGSGASEAKLAQSSLEKEVEQYLDLQTETEMLYERFQKLYKESQSSVGKQKQFILTQYKDAVSQYELKKIETSLLSQKITLATYNSNKDLIKHLVESTEHQKTVLVVIQQLEDEAFVAIKLAKEIREEANAQPNRAAKVGAYSNAEEKEILALQKQDKAINLLQKTAQWQITFSVNDLASN